MSHVDGSTLVSREETCARSVGPRHYNAIWRLGAWVRQLAASPGGASNASLLGCSASRRASSAHATMDGKAPLLEGTGSAAPPPRGNVQTGGSCLSRDEGARYGSERASVLQVMLALAL